MRAPIKERFSFVFKPPIDCLPKNTEYKLYVVAVVCPCCLAELYGGLCDINRSGIVYASNSQVASISEFKRNFLDDLAEIQSMEVCPVCGGKLSKESEYFKIELRKTTCTFDYFSPYKEAEYIFRGMYPEIYEGFKAKAKESVQEYIKECTKGLSPNTSKNPEAGSSLSSTGVLKSYIHHILSLEAGVYDLSARLENLYITKKRAVIDAVHRNNKEISSLNDKIYDCKKYIVDVSKINISDIPLPKAILPEMPTEPQKPVFTDRLPEAPPYQKPNIFNKKRVLAKNRALKARYDKALSEYNKNKQIYEKAVAEHYIKDLDYKIALENYQKDCEQKKAEAELKYKNAVEMRKKEAEIKNLSITSKIKSLEERIKELSAKPSSLDILMLDREIEATEKLLKEFAEALKGAYDVGMIYPKYRNIVAVSSFCDYLLSGRCQTLEGTDGAYNTFEIEARNNIIITKLSDAIESLDSIQNSQYMLYEKLSETEAGVSDTNSSMKKAIDALRESKMNSSQMIELLNTIETNPAKAKDSSEVASHHSKVTEYYAKKSAELTNASEYLAAL